MDIITTVVVGEMKNSDMKHVYFDALYYQSYLLIYILSIYTSNDHLFFVRI